jgi:selenocysteine lyase/cysteine desulfurase
VVDVQEFGCDFLACSTYKFFGPHVGILWGKEELLAELQPYKLRPVPETLPDRWMTGTQNHEGLAGVVAAVDYLASLGKEPGTDRRRRVRAAMVAVQDYEATLTRKLLDALADRPRFKVWGITDRERLRWRVPTISITTKDRTPEQMAEHLAAREIYAWNGNMYALLLTERLGLEDRGGFLRLGMVHYNTPEEIDRLVKALDELP